MTINKNKVEPKTPFEKSILLLENDLDALGWDQPPRLYALMGEQDDYTLELVTTMTGHPVDFMRMMVSTGHFADEVVGVAIATEGWRHPHYDEMSERHPDVVEKIQAAAESLGIQPDEARERAAKVYNDAMSNYRPSENPERIEIRNVMVVMRDGRTMGVHRDRGSEAELMETMGGGRVIDAMKALMIGTWPKGLMTWEEEEARESDEGRLLQQAIDSVRKTIRDKQQKGHGHD